jgi:hypothetical protein
VESENTDGFFERWREYRNRLTDEINELITSETDKNIPDKKPTLAIWGAGGCNDIDIGRLSSLAKLVLIDCEKNRTRAAVERYGLDEKNVVTVDLFFYDIPYERYLQWEELLSEGVSIDELHEFLSELLLEAVSTDMMMLPEFDYSVAVGITSQLNSRLAALFYMYSEKYSLKEREDVLKHIAIMDRKAVERLYMMVNRTTAKGVIWGYEKSVNETGEQLLLEGNKRLTELIQADDKNNSIDRVFIDWPFIEGKTYSMQIIKLC